MGTEKWGYARVSVDRVEQAAGWDVQHAKLKELGCTEIVSEEASTKGPRPLFDDLLARANREATPDRRICICAYNMDRAFRDIIAAATAINKPINRNVIWLLADLSPTPLDPTDATQMLLVHVMGAVGQFERDRAAERRAYGIAKAKADGKYKGRVPTARAKTDEVLRYKAKGNTPEDIAKLLDVSRASVYRILKDAKAG